MSMVRVCHHSFGSASVASATSHSVEKGSPRWQLRCKAASARPAAVATQVAPHRLPRLQIALNFLTHQIMSRNEGPDSHNYPGLLVYTAHRAWSRQPRRCADDDVLGRAGLGATFTHPTRQRGAERFLRDANVIRALDRAVAKLEADAFERAAQAQAAAAGPRSPHA